MLFTDFQHSLWDNESQILAFTGKKRVIGVDEVGRGCLAGPVIAVAILFQIRPIMLQVYDSKMISAKKRESLLSEIMATKPHLGVAFCSAKTIDHYNILNATKQAMQSAVLRCVNTLPQEWKKEVEICIDGNFAISLPEGLSQVSVVKGDSLIASVAAASIVAKVVRDRYMTSLNRFFPDYCFHQHKGYGTVKHYREIDEYGLTDYHRRTFLQGKIR
jgi:ribonuclease HII